MSLLLTDGLNFETDTPWRNGRVPVERNAQPRSLLLSRRSRKQTARRARGSKPPRTRLVWVWVWAWAWVWVWVWVGAPHWVWARIPSADAPEAKRAEALEGSSEEVTMQRRPTQDWASARLPYVP